MKIRCRSISQNFSECSAFPFRISVSHNVVNAANITSRGRSITPPAQSNKPLSNIGKRKRALHIKALFFGASNGNRTRIASLGSWSFTIRLYPRTCILYTIPRHLSRGISNFFSLSENFRPTRRDIFFPRPRTFAAYRHMMIVETAPALSYFIPSGGSL